MTAITSGPWSPFARKSRSAGWSVRQIMQHGSVTSRTKPPPAACVFMTYVARTEPSWEPVQPRPVPSKYGAGRADMSAHNQKGEIDERKVHASDARLTTPTVARAPGAWARKVDAVAHPKLQEGRAHSLGPEPSWEPVSTG
jgi:hypothetical protein